MGRAVPEINSEGQIVGYVGTITVGQPVLLSVVAAGKKHVV